MTNLEMLAEAEKDMDPQKKWAFQNYFVGALSHLANKRDWAQALATAARCLEQYGQRRVANG